MLSILFVVIDVIYDLLKL